MIVDLFNNQGNMKTIKEIQDFIFLKAGLKTSVKKGSGSMKGYLIISPMFQNGSYPNIPFDLTRELQPLLSYFNSDANPVFCSTSNIAVFNIEDDRIKFKTERKAKVTEVSAKGWGSKNSQMRLDKASSRYAKKLRGGGNHATYY